MISSADPSTSPGEGQTIAAPGSQDISSPMGKGDRHGMEMDSGLEGRGIDTGQLDMSRQEQSVGLHRSVRATKVKPHGSRIVLLEVSWSPLGTIRKGLLKEGGLCSE